jgi:hypothetical protein
MTSVSGCGMAGRNLSLPVNLIIARPLASSSPVSIGAGVCYWNSSTDAGTNGVAIRFGASIPFN